MVKINYWAVSLGVSICGVLASAEEAPSPSRGDSATAASQPAAAAPAVPAATDKNKIKVAEAAAQLNGTAWVIDLAPMSGEKPKRPLKDTLRFEQGKLTSEKLAADGYPSSNYTLTMGDDGIPVLETMQTNETKGVVFWRGEVSGDTLRGILSKHPLEGNSEDYSFAGRPANAAPEPQAGAAPAPAAQANQPAKPHEETAPKKQSKKGWFGR